MSRQMTLRAHYRERRQVKHTPYTPRSGNRAGNGQRTLERQARQRARREYVRRTR